MKDLAEGDRLTDLGIQRGILPGKGYVVSDPVAEAGDNARETGLGTDAGTENQRQQRTHQNHRHGAVIIVPVTLDLAHDSVQTLGIIAEASVYQAGQYAAENTEGDRDPLSAQMGGKNLPDQGGAQ